MCIVAVHLNLGHKREGYAVVDAAEFGNLLVAARLLVSKLVARETDNNQTTVLITLIKSLQTIILRGKATLGCGVDNHQDFAFELREVHFCALIAQGLEIVNLCHIFIIYIVHDANIGINIYIANDIYENMQKTGAQSQPQLGKKVTENIRTAYQREHQSIYRAPEMRGMAYIICIPFCHVPAIEQV